MSKSIHLIVVGKLKSSNFEAIEKDYLQRISNPQLKIHEVKANAENVQAEGLEVIKKIKDISKDSTSFVITLSEDGIQRESTEFSNWLFNIVENHQQKIIFVIAGAQGHSAEVVKLSNQKLSLSKLTFPHKIARILFIEQFYRAITIKNNHPYHN